MRNQVNSKELGICCVYLALIISGRAESPIGFETVNAEETLLGQHIPQPTDTDFLHRALSLLGIAPGLSLQAKLSLLTRYAVRTRCDLCWLQAPYTISNSLVNFSRGWGFLSAVKTTHHNHAWRNEVLRPNTSDTRPLYLRKRRGWGRAWCSGSVPQIFRRRAELYFHITVKDNICFADFKYVQSTFTGTPDVILKDDNHVLEVVGELKVPWVCEHFLDDKFDDEELSSILAQAGLCVGVPQQSQRNDLAKTAR